MPKDLRARHDVQKNGVKKRHSICHIVARQTSFYVMEGKHSLGKVSFSVSVVSANRTFGSRKNVMFKKRPLEKMYLVRNDATNQ